jgi:hypothetical protein
VHRTGEDWGGSETCRDSDGKGELPHGEALRTDLASFAPFAGSGNSQCGERQACGR